VIPVGGVFAEILPDLFEQADDLFPPQEQQRPDQEQIPFPPGGGHPGQGGRAAAPQQPDQDGLRLVVGLVPEGQGPDPGPARDFPEIPVADDPGRLLRGITPRFHLRPDLPAGGDTGQPEPGRQRFHPAAVGAGRLTPQAMVEVNHGQVKGSRLPQPAEQVEEGDGIGAPGDRDQEPVSALPEAVTGGVIRHPPDQDRPPRPPPRPGFEIFFLVTFRHFGIL
jgi:hypothetical protein